MRGYLNKYFICCNSLLRNLPTSTNYLLTKPNLFLQHIYYFSNNQESALHFQTGDTNKLEILKSIKGKSGIYMWTNKLNAKKYVGSSVDLRCRLLEYYNTNRLLDGVSMPIYKALLKHGCSNFSLDILEFCDKDNLILREKHYFNIYSPEYNILKEPLSPSRGKGWKHSEATIEKMKLAANNLSAENLLQRSLSHKDKKLEVTDITTGLNTIYHAIRAAARALNIDRRYIEKYIYLKQVQPVRQRYLFKLIEEGVNKDNIRLQKTSQKVVVTDVETNDITIYSSVTSAAKSLGLHQASISLYLKDKRTKPFKDKYIFKLIS